MEKKDSALRNSFNVYCQDGDDSIIAMFVEDIDLVEKASGRLVKGFWDWVREQAMIVFNSGGMESLSIVSVSSHSALFSYMFVAIEDSVTEEYIYSVFSLQEEVFSFVFPCRKVYD